MSWIGLNCLIVEKRGKKNTMRHLTEIYFYLINNKIKYIYIINSGRIKLNQNFQLPIRKNQMFDPNLTQILN